MSRSDITNVAPLESLNDALKDYGMQSLAVVRDFASILINKISNVSGYRGYLEQQVRIAEQYYESCLNYQAVAPPEYRPSCNWQASLYNNASSNLEQYQRLLSDLNRAYDSFMNRYSSYSNYVDGQLQSSINSLQCDIVEIKKYMNNQM